MLTVNNSIPFGRFEPCGSISGGSIQMYVNGGVYTELHSFSFRHYSREGRGLPSTRTVNVRGPDPQSIYNIESVQVVGRRSIPIHRTLRGCGGIVNMH